MLETPLLYKPFHYGFWDDPVTPYVGDRPGPFSVGSFGFVIAWAPAFVVAALLARRWARLRAAPVRA